MCHDPRSYGDGGAFTDIFWRVRRVGIEKIVEEEATFRCSSIVGYWA